MFKPDFSSAADDYRAAPLSLWSRWAVLLSFVAVLCLLVAPASLLAQDLKTGKLGGVCTTLKAGQAGEPADADDTPAHGHCPLCSVSSALPAAGLGWAPASAAAQGAPLPAVADPAARVTGLPFSRAPPAL